jgi:hypothetical protein
MGKALAGEERIPAAATTMMLRIVMLNGTCECEDGRYTEYGKPVVKLIHTETWMMHAARKMMRR